MFLIVFDPTTDFALQPWLVSTIGQGLKLGEVVGGDYVFRPPGEENISIYGFPRDAEGQPGPTGTGIDQSMFLTMETACRMSARVSDDLAEKPLLVPENRSRRRWCSGWRPAPIPQGHGGGNHASVPEVTTVVSGDLFQSQRRSWMRCEEASSLHLRSRLALSDHTHRARLLDGRQRARAVSWACCEPWAETGCSCSAPCWPRPAFSP